MATRPDSDLRYALLKTRIVESATTVTIGSVVKDGNADGECQPTTDGVGAIGVVTAMGGNTTVTAGAAGDRVQVAMLAGACVIPVKVGTGGATRGLFAKVVADGVTSASPSVSTPTGVDVVGMFTQSGVAGDLVGMIPARGWLTE
jgi:hypothetical protein